MSLNRWFSLFIKFSRLKLHSSMLSVKPKVPSSHCTRENKLNMFFLLMDSKLFIGYEVDLNAQIAQTDGNPFNY